MKNNEEAGKSLQTKTTHTIVYDVELYFLSLKYTLK